MKNTIYPRFIRGFFRFNAQVAVALALLSFSLLPSCNDLDTIGLDLVETRIRLNSTDTTTIRAYTLSEDSLLTTNAELHLLGFINDPLFGKSSASIYTEALPGSLSQAVTSISSDLLVVDSVVLSLAYAGYAGNLNVHYTARVFELGEIIPIDTIYSNRVLQVKKEIPVINPVFRPMPRTKVFLDPDSVAPHLRIKLDPQYGRKMVLYLDSLARNQKRFSTYDEFRAYLSGFLIQVEETSQPGAILYFNLRGTFSRFQIFYSQAGTTNKYVYSLNFGDGLGRRYTRFDNFGHQHAAEILRSQVLNSETLLGDSLLFLQSMANYRVRIQLPYITNLLTGQSNQVAINSARLIFPIETDLLPDSINTATALILYRENPAKPGKIIPLDDQVVSSNYFGGFIDRRKMEYSFNITKHIQRVFEDPTLNTPLYLRVSNGVQIAGRVALKGPKRNNPLRLEIIYSQPVLGNNN